jgi:hypothetical protein
MHRSSMLYIQTVLYIAEARVAKSTWTIDDLPRTAHDTRSRSNPASIRQILYRKGFERIAEFNSTASEWLQPHANLECEAHIKLKHITLLPLEFEAVLHLAEVEPGLDEDSLLHIIEQASRNNAPPQTFALFADMTLAAALTKDTEESSEQPPRLPISSAATVLRKIISVVRKFDNYDLTQASRWIRCIFQLILGTGGPAEEGKAANIELLDEITSQALVLANSPRGEVGMTGHDEIRWYPADELEWLCTMLFNLAVDFYVAEEAEAARRWAWKALEVADVLAAAGEVGGDGGVLVRVLRERMGKLGWLGPREETKT